MPPRFGFVGVPNALNLELNLLALFKVALVPAFVACCVELQSGKAPSPQRSACCARGWTTGHRKGIPNLPSEGKENLSAVMTQY
jgi:hypothetical protein